ncbi:MAG: M20/M25/M40 family metallo-hydrolase [Thermoflexibacter sp.]|jgi:acetylornithine deacetylase/succinyl-diaminopimelate desuccinylase-like protein|nr:M20/M25/M40 family metallo-hydrolase [Thermoflexibacter sp.]
MKKTLLYFTFCFLLYTQASAQDIIEKVRNYRKANEHRLLSEYLELLAIPNIATDSANIYKNATFIMDMMKNRGISNVQLLGAGNTPTFAPPAIYGEVIVPNAKRTIIFYAHYDGQPVNPLQWAQGLVPFKPVFMDKSLEKDGKIIETPDAEQAIDPEWRIYARSTSDDKGGVFAILNAYQALVQSKIKLTSNIKFFFEGEEEAGSPHLGRVLEKHKHLLQSDLWIILDGPVHQSGRKQVVFGVRGDVNMSIKIFASKRPLHSGHYGNWAPNPAMQLARLLASMKDETGKVLIDGFYDDVTPLTDSEKQALAQIPPADEQMRLELGFAQPEGGGKSLVEAISLPSLNINGMQSANVGAMAANVIPTTATAVLDLRLVKGNDHRKQVEKVANHIRKQGYHVITEDPTEEERLKYPLIAKINAKDGYNAQRTPMDLPIAQLVVRAVQSTSQEPIVLLPSSGGSLPLYLFEKHLNTPTITVGIANHDNNQHAENENIRIKNLWNGIETVAAMMLIK